MEGQILLLIMFALLAVGLALRVVLLTENRLRRELELEEELDRTEFERELIAIRRGSIFPEKQVLEIDSLLRRVLKEKYKIDSRKDYPEIVDLAARQGNPLLSSVAQDMVDLLYGGKKVTVFALDPLLDKIEKVLDQGLKMPLSSRVNKAPSIKLIPPKPKIIPKTNPRNPSMQSSFMQKWLEKLKKISQEKPKPSQTQKPVQSAEKMPAPEIVQPAAASKVSAREPEIVQLQATPKPLQDGAKEVQTKEKSSWKERLFSLGKKHDEELPIQYPPEEKDSAWSHIAIAGNDSDVEIRFPSKDDKK